MRTNPHRSSEELLLEEGEVELENMSVFSHGSEKAVGLASTVDGEATVEVYDHGEKYLVKADTDEASYRTFVSNTVSLEDNFEQIVSGQRLDRSY